MTIYRYRAVAPSGETLEDVMEADGEAAVVASLQASGCIPIRVAETKRHSLARPDLDLFAPRPLSQRELGEVARQISTLLHAGLPLDRSLETLSDLADRGHQKKVLLRVLERVRRGSSLAEAVTAQPREFPRLFVTLVRAGEASGNLEEVLNRLAHHLERAHAIKENIRTALLYPAIVMFLSGVSLVVLFMVVLPQFRPLFEGSGHELPLLTQIVLALGAAFESYWWALVLGASALFLLGYRQFKNPRFRARFDAFVLRVPLLGDLVAKTEVAGISRTLGTLLSNGVVLLTALNITRDTAMNGTMAKAIDKALAGLKEGKGLAEPLRQTELFPPLAVRLVRVGEEAGRLDEMLLKVAEIFDQQVQQAIERLLTLLVPGLTIALGLIVAIIIISILMAILSVYELAL